MTKSIGRRVISCIAILFFLIPVFHYVTKSSKAYGIASAFVASHAQVGDCIGKVQSIDLGWWDISYSFDFASNGNAELPIHVQGSSGNGEAMIVLTKELSVWRVTKARFASSGKVFDLQLDSDITKEKAAKPKGAC